jgi:hypothetical protein
MRSYLWCNLSYHSLNSVIRFKRAFVLRSIIWGSGRAMAVEGGLV